MSVNLSITPVDHSAWHITSIIEESMRQEYRVSSNTSSGCQRPLTLPVLLANKIYITLRDTMKTCETHFWLLEFKDSYLLSDCRGVFGRVLR